jgi:hypothetical protein
MAVNKRKRDGKYEVTVWDSSRGKKRYVGVYDRLVDAKRAEVDAIGRRADRHSTVGEFAARWTTDYPRNAESTNRHNAERVKRFAERYANTPMNSVTSDTARSWCLDRKGDLLALRAMFNDAKRSGFLVVNPFTDLGIDRGRGRKDLQGDWLTADDIKHLAECAARFHESNGLLKTIIPGFIRFAAYTGLRGGELYALEHADLVGDELHVDRALNQRTGKIALPKGDKTRVIALLPQAREAYESLPRVHDDLVFTNKTGGMLTQGTLHSYWNPVRTIAGRPELVIHELRHFHASWLLDQGLDASAVAVQLGHSSAELIYSTYGHPSERAARNRVLNAARIAHDGDHGVVRKIADTR